MSEKNQGTLVIIGGAEDKDGECRILREFFTLAGGVDSSIVILTTATKAPDRSGTVYTRIFRKMGASQVNVCEVQNRLLADKQGFLKTIREATGIFFSGGDQLRITSILGGTPLEEALVERYRSGAVIAGTSAGASAMSDLMIVEGDSDQTPKKCTLKMAPGLGLLRESVIDQHFAQRGRIGRLLLAVSQNPYVLGIGLDEDTAIIVRPNACFEVIGSQTVTILDGRSIRYTNVSELKPDQSLAVVQGTLHVLPNGYRFDMQARAVRIPDLDDRPHPAAPFMIPGNEEDYLAHRSDANV